MIYSITALLWPRRGARSTGFPAPPWLPRRPETEAGGDVSALLERVVQAAAVDESAKQHAAWYATQPGYAEAAEAERYAA